MARTRKHNDSRLKNLEDFLHHLSKIYGPTFSIDMNLQEQKKLLHLQKRVDFELVSCDHATHD